MDECPMRRLPTDVNETMDAVGRAVFSRQTDRTGQQMSTLRRVIVATRKSDLAWALHHEVKRQPTWNLVATIDPREVDALENVCKTADIVLIEADDLIWLWDHRLDEITKTLACVRAVVVLSDRQMLDVVVRAHENCGLLLRAEYGDVPVDLLELAIRGYMSLSSTLLHRLTTDQLRLDIVGDLSAEELKILSYIGAKLSNRGIAEASGFTETRVKTLVRLVTRKLRLQNRTGVAVFANVNGLVHQPIGREAARMVGFDNAISDEN
jgi:DNA-binding NarL/FixJ family response regulator